MPDRGESLHVIGAGYGRTGTASLKVALEELGVGPCYHMWELFDHPEHVPLWLAAWAGEPVDWTRVFAGYRATVDWPGGAFWPQLRDAYPQARVLLSVRDPESWYRSTLYTIHQASADEAGALAAADQDPARRMINTIIWQGTFGGRFREKDEAIALYERHNREVQARVPAERLLVYQVQEAWEPLCRFLGVAVPEKPFPHLNTRQEWEQRRREAAAP